MRAILVSMMAILAACAIGPEMAEAPAHRAAGTLPAPAQLLSSFAAYELKPMVFGDAITGNEEKLKKAREFEQSLDDRVLPLLESWKGSGREGSSGTVSIESKLIKLRVVSNATRFWTPSVAVGDSHIDMDLRLVNTTTGEEIANVEIRTNARKWGSAYTGVSDETIDEYAVAIVYNYLSDNY